MAKEKELESSEEFKELQVKVGLFIKKARIDLGYESAESFAYAHGYTRSQYFDYENGNANPTIFTLFKLLKKVGVDPDEFFNLNLEGVKSSDINADFDKVEQLREQVRVARGNVSALKVKNESYYRIYKTLIFCVKPKTKSEILNRLNLKNTTNNFRRAVGLALDMKWLEMTDPQNPNSPHQMYITTQLGKSAV